MCISALSLSDVSFKSVVSTPIALSCCFILSKTAVSSCTCLENDHEGYNTIFLQFLVCGYLLWKELKSLQSVAVTTEWSSILLYPIPSIIYLVHNNVLFLTLTYVDTSIHQIMGNLKIFTIGILFSLLIQLKILLVL